jgi:pyruvate dehydrogenase E1 component alpha subunit/2-oxoisovalerate dehydrogenase E1 component alpha subunit
MATIGEGGMQTGASHEGINIAAVEKVPFVLVATNNRFAYSTPNDRQFGCVDLIDRAAAYGYDGHTVDGTDLTACLEVIGTAVERARAGGPPQMVVANVLRLAGHGEHDDASYVPPEMRGESYARDSVTVAEDLIRAQELMSADELQQLREELVAEVNDAINTAQTDPTPRRAKTIGRQWRSPSWRTNTRERHLSRGDPRSAGAGVTRRRSRLHLRPGHRGQIRRRI